MPPRRAKRHLTPPVSLPSGAPEDEEVFSVHSVEDSSVSPAPDYGIQTRSSKRLRSNGNRKVSPKVTRQTRSKRQNGRTIEKVAPPSVITVDDAVTISDESSNGYRELEESKEENAEDEDLILEDVDIPHHRIDQSQWQQSHSSTPLQSSIAEDVDEEGEEELELEDVDVFDEHQDEAGMEGVDHTSAYYDAYRAVNTVESGVQGGDEGEPVIFKDGKGQMNGISISLGKVQRASKVGSAKKTVTVTPRDRLIRLATHKWTVLSLIAHTRIRNEWLNDEDLRDRLFSLVPNIYLDKIRMIHKKKVPLQTERVRLFEIFLNDLTVWWSRKFVLDPKLTICGALRQPNADMLAGIFPKSGRRVDGWMVESTQERENRHREERKRRTKALEEVRKTLKEKGVRKTSKSTKPDSSMTRKKGKEKETIAPIENVRSKLPSLLKEITLFGIGDSTKPVYLRLADVQHRLRSIEDLKSHVESMSGSREDSAQLFTALCRSMGIPARLVISIQCPSWSVGASKVAASIGAVNNEKGGKLVQRKNVHEKDVERKRQLNTIRKAIDVMTSDEESFSNDSTTERGDVRTDSKRPIRAKVTLKVGSKLLKSRSATASPSSSKPPSLAEVPLESNLSSNRKVQGTSASTNSSPAEKSNKATKKSEKEESDYRSEKWKGLQTPLDVKYEPKLRTIKAKPLKPTEVATEEADADPVDLQSPPTMWVEVFSKPWQKWISVDPVRGIMSPTGNRQMEPTPSDRSNRLVYVLAFEEDGHARDVTARYTRTLHSRISRMRPPLTKRGGMEIDWWSKVMAALERQEKFPRDLEEDNELQSAASREPMPSSVAAFKDHPVYTLEKHLKRDEVIFPAKQAGTFQGIPVFLRANVVACRSSRQWYNEGRVVREGQEALKWVKSRGYTLANKRAEEEARQQGLDGLQEGLYANFQTEVYTAPPVVDGKIPTNAFGNVDLFVESMLPPGGVHVPYNGAGKVAKSMNIPYAEAVVGFEFRKHRGMPKINGIVVAEEYGDDVTQAYLEYAEEAAEKAEKRKKEQLIKARRKAINAKKIKARLERDYLTGAKGKSRRQDWDSDEDTLSEDDEVVYDDDDDEDDDDDDVDEEEEEEEEKDGEEDEHRQEGEADEGEPENLKAYHDTQRKDADQSEDDEEGGFIVE